MTFDLVVPQLFQRHCHCHGVSGMIEDLKELLLVLRVVDAILSTIEQLVMVENHRLGRLIDLGVVCGVLTILG
jgi:hypothetical protein